MMEEEVAPAPSLKWYPVLSGDEILTVQGHVA